MNKKRVSAGIGGKNFENSARGRIAIKNAIDVLFYLPEHVNYPINLLKYYKVS